MMEVYIMYACRGLILKLRETENHAGKTFEKGLFVSAGKDGRIACWNIYGDKM